MLAKISVEKTSVLDEMLMCPYSLQYLSENGRQPADPNTRGMHNDGSGLAFANNGAVEIHKRDKKHAWDDSYRNVARTATSNIFIAHNRLASKGLDVGENGAHPFSMTAGNKTFALCHNGGVRSYMDEAKKLHTSDSFLFLQHLVDSSGKNSADEIFSRLSSIAAQTEYTSLCAFMITNEELFVWRVYNKHEVVKAEGYEKYYTLYMSIRNNSVLFSSEPLDDQPWMLLQNGTFLHLKVNGAAITSDMRMLDF